eukprot:14120651-Ditylum_brightwellii.AAC.1
MVECKAECLKDELEEKKEASCSSVLFEKERQKCNNGGGAMIIGETLTAYHLGRVATWEQLFTDGTGCWQVALQNLVLSLVENEVVWSLVLITSIILDNETSERQCNLVLKMIGTARQ